MFYERSATGHKETLRSMEPENIKEPETNWIHGIVRTIATMQSAPNAPKLSRRGLRAATRSY